MNKTLNYSKENIPVKDGYDVVVVGGGTSGVMATISALMEGMSVLVVESKNGLGGSATAAFVSPMMGNNVYGNPRCAVDQLVLKETLKIGGNNPDNLWDFNPVPTQIVMERLVMEYGGKVLFDTYVIDTVVEDNKLKYVIVSNKGGIQAIGAKCFIDCTGDADVCYHSGVEYESGSPTSGRNQDISLRFEMGGIDIPTLFDFIHTFERAPNKKEKYKEFCEDCYSKGIVQRGDLMAFQAFPIYNKPGCVSFNCPDMGGQVNVLDPDFLSQKYLEAKQIIYRLSSHLIAHVPGCENGYLAGIASMMGVRESRRIKAEYILTADDILHYRKFPDGIAVSDYYMDVHDGDVDHRSKMKYIDAPGAERYYEIPFRSLIPLGIDNLLCAGRCSGTDFYAQSTTRIQHTCKYMGEAAGIGAALAIKENIAVRDIDGSKVRKIMADRGVEILAK